MRIVVIGLGSMGKRRIRLIREMYPEYKIFGVDSREDRRVEVSSLYKIICFSSISEIKDNMDCAFVCTSPLSHATIIRDCLNKGWHVFTEINLVDDGYDENMYLAQKKGCVLFLSSTFLYREETKYIQSVISKDKKWNYIYHIGQYLPDWHPWENYRDFFVGDNRTNGCREIMTIELPWLTQSFGEIEKTQVISDKMTDLNIGYDDNYFVQICHKNGNKGIFIVDVVSPVAVRKLEIYSENAYISWSGTPDSIYEFDFRCKKLIKVELSEPAEHKEGYSNFIVENAYKNEISEFFDVVMTNKQPMYGFEQDKRILEIVNSIGA